jgi:hypothetical protein
MPDVSTWEKIAATFTAVGGVGAMLGAAAAWRAALASGQASRDARDALAASLKPQVHLVVGQFGESVEARAVVLGPLSPMGLAGVLPAADVRLEFNSTGGRQDSAFISHLEPNPGGSWARVPPYLNVVIGKASEDWPSEEGEHVTATVTFSDMRRVGSYERSTSVDLRRSADPGAVSFQNVTEGIDMLFSEGVSGPV